MQFCNKCGSMVVNQNGAMTYANGDYGGAAERDEELVAESVSTEAWSDDELIETEEGAEFEDKLTAEDVHCDDCGHMKAWYTTKQTRSADEPSTQFFRCQERRYWWRGYN